jgi:hypothetical protein
MNVVVKDPAELQKQFSTSVEKAKDVAANLAELFERLKTLGGDCMGMKVSMGSSIFVVVREGDTFVLIPEKSY